MSSDDRVLPHHPPMGQLAHPTRRAELINGMKATLPLVVGGVPFGIIFGALAVSSGISPLATMGLSAFVFAGSAQFIATGLIAQGAGAFVISLTTLVVNLRHTLYAATLAPHVRGLSQQWLIPLGFWLTDETFVIVINRYNQADAAPHKHWYWLGSSVMMYISWQIATWIGIVAGGAIPDAAAWGLDFAMVATFIGMIVPMVKNRPTLAAVLVAGIVGVLAHGLPHQLGLIAAALVGTFLGILISYGFIAPMVGNLEQKLGESTKYYQSIKAALIASMNGYAPPTAVEFGRKVIFSHDRPGFVELEQHLKANK